MPIDSRAFVEPSIAKTRVHAQQNTVLLAIGEKITEVEAKGRIAVVVSPNETAVDPDESVAEHSVELYPDAPPCVAGGDLELAAVPAHTILRIAPPQWLVTMRPQLAVALATVVVRGGNDAFEAFSNGELYAVNYAYNHVHAGQTIGAVSPNLPYGQRNIESVPVFTAAGGGTPPVSSDRRALLRARPIYIILSQSQEAWGELVAGYTKGWELSLEASLLNNGYHIVASWQTATVLKAGSFGT